MFFLGNDDYYEYYRKHFPAKRIFRPLNLPHTRNDPVALTMAQKANLDQECKIFSSERIHEIVILRLKENLLFRATDFNERDKVIDVMD